MFDGEEYTFIPKRRISRAFETLVRQISDIIYDEYDPIGVKGLAPRDEYDGMAVRVASRMRQAESLADVKRIVIEVAGDVFEMDPPTQEQLLETVAKDIWQAWQVYSEQI